MPSLRDHTSTLLLAGSVGLFVVLAALQLRGTAAEPDWHPVATSTATSTVPSPATAAPSAGNVAPTVHARLMRLRSQLEASPEDADALLDLARLEQDAHQFESAASHYERFLALRPTERQPWLDLANAYAGAGQWDNARDVSERMLDQFPDDPAPMYNLGAIAANAGRADEARRWWTAVRDGSDPKLAEQATASLAQLAGMRSAPSRPAASPGRNPHAVATGASAAPQPIVAHRIRGVDTE